MSKWPCAVAVTSTVLLLAGSVRAEGAYDDDEVVVRGRAGGGFVSRAREGDAPREITDAASLIAPMPGVHVRRLGADDSFATLSIRGTSSTQVAVFLAGVPLSGGADPTLDLATLPLWPGAEARVYRSFAPAALGRGSLGGSLVLDPPSPRAPARTDVWTAVGSFGARRLRAGDIRDVGGVRVATGISASRSDDDFTYVVPFSSPEATATRVNAGHAAASGLASIAVPAGAGALTLTTLAQGRKQELPGPLGALTPRQRLDSTRLVAALELTQPAGPGAAGVRAWARREGLSLHDAPDSPFASIGGPTRTADAIVAAGASAGWKGSPSEATRLEARVDGSAERYAPGTWQNAATPPGARRTNTGAALDASVRGPVDVSLGARGDVWIDAAEDGPSRAEARPTGHVGVERALGPVVVTSHAGVLARPPSFVERFGNRGVFLPEPDLKPESATTLDLGARARGRVGRLRAEAELAGFVTWAEDLIVFVNQGAYGRAKATNIGEARLVGVEAQARASALGTDVRASYTGLSTANLSTCASSSPGACERPALPGRPRHDFVLDATYTIGPLRVRYGLDVVAGIQPDLAGALEVPARALHSAGARLDVPGVRGLVFALDVRNLFDLRAVEYAGVLGPTRAPIGDLYDFPLPGRSFLASLRWTSPGPGTPTDRDPR